MGFGVGFLVLNFIIISYGVLYGFFFLILLNFKNFIREMVIFYLYCLWNIIGILSYWEVLFLEFESKFALIFVIYRMENNVI